MPELTSTTIIPIAIYCFLLAIYFLSVGFNTIFCANPNILTWIFGLIAFLLSIGFFFMGMGVLNGKPFYWKILFFSLTITVTCSTSIIIAFLFILWLGENPIMIFLPPDQVTPVMWFSFLAVFLSSIIVLYYLSQEQVIKHFGELGPLISPF